MRLLFPSIKTKPVFTLNFTLAYIGVLILEISIAGTELLKLYPESKTEVIEIRIIHGVFAFVLIFATKLILKVLKIEKTGYIGLALVGLWIAIPSLLFRIFLMENFDLITNSQIHSFFVEQFFISLIQAFFWIPAAIILGGQRILILEAFKEYEKRLIISARKKVRESHDFIVLKKEVDNAFRNELIMHTSLLLKLLDSSDDKKLSLKERNEIMQRCLRENALREFSQRLNQKSEVVDRVSKYEQDMRSLNLIRKQFNILYNFTARKEPLPAWVYTLLSFALLLPTYINFYTLTEVLICMPGFLVIHLIAIQINKILSRGGKYAILQLNLLTLLIGFLPFIQLTLLSATLPNLTEQFPFLISAVIYPFGFFVYMRFIQIIQPEAINAITGDKIYASSSLKEEISNIVMNEVKQSMSHQWATFIHGKILTRLAATSLKLEQAFVNDDTNNFEVGLANIKSLLSDPTREFEQNIFDLKTEISSRLDPWDGLITIKVKIEPELADISNERVRDLGEVIEEIISNSVRHGGSQNISINITSITHPDIVIHIEDDGVNPLPLSPSRIGLGTKILNLVSDGRWSISRTDLKTTVELKMSLLEKQMK
jgi:two-component sensor histidine kinase